MAPTDNAGRRPGTIATLLLVVVLIAATLATCDAKCSEHNNECNACVKDRTRGCVYQLEAGKCTTPSTKPNRKSPYAITREIWKSTLKKNCDGDVFARAVELDEVGFAEELVGSAPGYAPSTVYQAAAVDARGDRYSAAWQGARRRRANEVLEQRLQAWKNDHRSKNRPVLDQATTAAETNGLGLQFNFARAYQKEYPRSEDFPAVVAGECEVDSDCPSTAARPAVCCATGVGHPKRSPGTCTFAGACFVSTASAVLFSNGGLSPTGHLAASGAPSQGRALGPHDERATWMGHCRGLEIQDQGLCSTCWAHALTSSLSQRLCRATGGAVDVLLSPQDLAEQVYLADRPGFRAYNRAAYAAGPGGQGTSYDHWLAWKDSGSGFSGPLKVAAQGEGLVPDVCKPYQCLPLSRRLRNLAKKYLKARHQWSDSASFSDEQSGGSSDAEARIARGAAGGMSPADRRDLKAALRAAGPLHSVLAFDPAGRCAGVIRSKVDPAPWKLPRKERAGGARTAAAVAPYDDDLYNTWGRVVTAVQREILARGPIVVKLYAQFSDEDYWEQGRGNNILYPQRFFGATDHAVAVVGWGEEDDGTEYWLLQNSWGGGGNVNGFFKVLKGFPCLRDPAVLSGTCGLDFFYAMAALERFGDYVVAAAPAAATVAQWVDLVETCRSAGGVVRCKNGGVLIRDAPSSPGSSASADDSCSCACKGNWLPGPRGVCTECPLKCNGNTRLNLDRCQCECRPGYYGPGCAAEAKATVACEGKSVKVSVATTGMGALGPHKREFGVFKTVNGAAGPTKEITLRGHTDDSPAYFAENLAGPPGQWVAWFKEDLGSNELGASKGSALRPVPVVVTGCGGRGDTAGVAEEPYRSEHVPFGRPGGRTWDRVAFGPGSESAGSEASDPGDDDGSSTASSSTGSGASTSPRSSTDGSPTGSRSSDAGLVVGRFDDEDEPASDARTESPSLETEDGWDGPAQSPYPEATLPELGNDRGARMDGLPWLDGADLAKLQELADTADSELTSHRSRRGA